MSYIVDLLQKNDLLAIDNYLLSNNINKTYDSDYTILHYAIKYASLDVCSYLLKQGAYIEACDIFGDSCLMHSIVNNRFNVFALLIKNNAYINRCNKNNQSPLLMATTLMRTQMVNVLLEDKNILITDECIFSLVKYLYNDKVIKILEDKSKLYIKDYNNLSLLHYAAKYNNLDLVKFLVTNKVYINILDRFRQNALFYAIKNENIDIITYLLDKGSYVNFTNIYNEDIFDISSSFVSYFIEYKINLSSYTNLIDSEKLHNLVFKKDITNILNYINKTNVKKLDSNGFSLLQICDILCYMDIKKIIKSVI